MILVLLYVLIKNFLATTKFGGALLPNASRDYGPAFE